MVSQLIERKRIDGIIRIMTDYKHCAVERPMKLIIIGEGESSTSLKNLSTSLGIDEDVIFKGRMDHDEMLPYLQHAQALLINTVKDNSMISIIESIACGTPVLSTSVPLNSPEIIRERLGIIKDDWGTEELIRIVQNNKSYVDNCYRYRDKLSNESKVDSFIREYEKYTELSRR